MLKLFPIFIIIEKFNDYKTGKSKRGIVIMPAIKPKAENMYIVLYASFFAFSIILSWFFNLYNKLFSSGKCPEMM